MKEQKQLVLDIHFMKIDSLFNITPSSIIKTIFNINKEFLHNVVILLIILS